MRSFLLLQKRPRTDWPTAYQDDYLYPQDLVEIILREFTQGGDCVFDPFAGFGTTLAAAEHLRRVPLEVEREPERVAFTRSRLAAKHAIIHGDSRYLDTLELPSVDFAMTSPPFMLKEDRHNPLATEPEQVVIDEAIADAQALRGAVEHVIDTGHTTAAQTAAQLYEWLIAHSWR